MVNEKIILIDQWKNQNRHHNLLNTHKSEIKPVEVSIELRPTNTENLMDYEDDDLSGMLIW